MTILLHALVAALYAGAAWLRWPRRDARTRRGLAAALLALALMLHALAIGRAIAVPDGLDLSFVNALSLVSALSVLTAW
ncbi:MAG TPA: inner membrane protein YpjD, partial [Casimicrobiaceae bacterium]|nr:inner membrane protein YpjD [Casimicrobiaceae bacterium]